MADDPSGQPLEGLVDRARSAPPNDRIEFRDNIAAHGRAAIDAMAEWLADPRFSGFAVRVVGKVADRGNREAAINVLEAAREEATPMQRADIDAELTRLRPAVGTRGLPRRAGATAVDQSIPGWMMRTDRYKAEYLWAEAVAGRLRQGWGYQPKQELTLLRRRREAGELLDLDDENAWPNRRMLSDEADGMRVDDDVLLPHLPREWRWSVGRITGPYRYEISVEKGDYGHILPVVIVTSDLGDEDLTPALRSMRTYPARLRRLSREAYDDLTRII